MMTTDIQLGCGLIRIGREWGFKKNDIPTSQEAHNFLKEAVNLGIRFFDTAPAYGLSEERLGKFLRTLSQDERSSLTIATKCGEHWNADKKETTVDHSYDALVRSIDNSLTLLGKIDVLQIHKATSAVLRSQDVHRALQYARSRGIKRFGASVSDRDTVELLCRSEELSVVQLPFNSERLEMDEALQKLKTKRKYLIVNRPFNMGEMVYKEQGEQSKQNLLSAAYSFIVKEDFSGVILTGTCNVAHLKENIAAFTGALGQLSHEK